MNEKLKLYERTTNRKEKVENVLKKRQPNLTIILENVHDPHNVSAVLRTADAVGIYEVHLIYHSGQKFPKKLGRKSSASARKWVKINYYDSVEECFNKVKEQGKKIYSTHLGARSQSLYELNLIQPVALAFGNEHQGLSDLALELSDGNFIIPQVGMIQSLNISVACAVTAYEAFRQRLLAGLYENSQFDINQFDLLYNQWIKK